VRQVVSLELKKAFRTKGFYIALMVGLLISLYHTVWIYRNVYAPNNKRLRNWGKWIRNMDTGMRSVFWMDG
jgi:hypothetical protein